jgi:hypothetical protein
VIKRPGRRAKRGILFLEGCYQGGTVIGSPVELFGDVLPAGRVAKIMTVEMMNLLEIVDEVQKQIRESTRRRGQAAVIYRFHLVCGSGL